ncbi:hypothetical protein [Sinorhizobium sp. A49]|uniref:hypothetical protein n=1 Tax=Sinorhizobium sp. A49 TaxID=1945861 RepID=UPI001FDA8EBA|nr:hypothetical protein [Sinorhizobium sp. A49]
MTKQLNTVRTHRPRFALKTTTAHLNRAAVQRGFLAGVTIPRLADAFGVTEFAMAELVAEHRQEWRAAEHRGIQEDDRRVVIFTRASRETGGVDVPHLSAPHHHARARHRGVRSPDGEAGSMNIQNPNLKRIFG